MGQAESPSQSVVIRPILFDSLAMRLTVVKQLCSTKRLVDAHPPVPPRYTLTVMPTSRYAVWLASCHDVLSDVCLHGWSCSMPSDSDAINACAVCARESTVPLVQQALGSTYHDVRNRSNDCFSAARELPHPFLGYWQLNDHHPCGNVTFTCKTLRKSARLSHSLGGGPLLLHCIHSGTPTQTDQHTMTSPAAKHHPGISHQCIFGHYRAMPKQPGMYL